MQSQMLSLSSSRRLLIAAAAAAAPLLAASQAHAYVYTNIDAIARATSSTGTTTQSRALSIDQSGEINGYYTPSGSTRDYFTLAPGSSTITPYPMSETFFTAAPATTSLFTTTGGGQLLNNSGTFLANSSSGAAGYDTGSFTPLPAASNYQGTFMNPIVTAASGGTMVTQTQTASSTPNPLSINSSGFIVGAQSYSTTTSTGTLNIGTLYHAYIYNPATGISTDLGGGEAGGDNATGQSQLDGIADNETVVGTASTPAANFRETTTDAVVGTTTTGGSSYSFADLGSVISTLATRAGGTYVTSAGTNISANGTYAVGTYTVKGNAAGSASTFTRSFEYDVLTSTAVDLGNFTTPGTNLVTADAVDDFGDVVGSAYANGVQNAFLYTAGTGIEDLNTIAPTAGVIFSAAYGINDAGSIVGVDNNTGNSGVATSGFLLSVPEPASISLLALGGLVLSVRRRVAR